MATKQQLETALFNADKAGDVPAARALAKALKNGDYDDQPEKSNFEKVKQFVTGEDRRTTQTDTLPELGSEVGYSQIFGEGNAGTAAKLTPALMTTLDPEGIVKIITSAAPEVGVTYNKDAQGNVFPILRNNKTGAVAQVNRPGISAVDVAQGLGLAALFTPAGRAGVGTASGIKAAAKVGLGSATTQAGLNTVQQASGRDASTGEIATEIGLAGAGGALVDGLFRLGGNAFRALRQRVKSGNIDDATRQVIIEQATKLGIPADEVTDAYIKQAFKAADNAFSADDATLTALEKEFNVTLSNAQRGGNVQALSAEDSIRSGARGSKAQDVFLQGEKKQIGQISNAAANLQSDIAKGGQLIGSTQEAGAALRSGVQNAESVADSAIEQAYKQVGDASITPEGFKGLLKATKNAARGLEYPQDPALVPAYATLKSNIVKAEVDLAKLSKMEGVRLKPVHIRRLEEIRRSIGTYEKAAANQTDRRNIAAMRNAFDGYLDDAVIQNLFTGDSASIEALKSARSVFKDYMTKFSPQQNVTRLGKGSDPSGEFIKKIILENPTDEQVINSLFTVGGFNKAGAAKMAQKYKGLLGAESEEWNMVRQAAFKNLVKTKSVNGENVISGQQTLSAINKAITSNKSLIGELFSPDEVSKLRRFALLIKRTEPDLPRSRENPSGTSQKLIKEAVNMLRTVMPFLDSHALFVTTGAGVVMKNRAAVNAAKQAFKPFHALNKGVIQSGSEGALIGQSQDKAKALMN